MGIETILTILAVIALIVIWAGVARGRKPSAPPVKPAPRSSNP
ncbi:MAG TPA: hypothetical protein VIM57_03625 [Luteolibacter sp.]